MSSTQGRIVPQALIIGTSLLLIQIGVAMVIDMSNYLALCVWDCGWYLNIVEKGYLATNIAFFPGYPLFAAIFRKLFNLETKNALLIAAQVATGGFWAYMYLFLNRCRISTPLIVAMFAGFLVQPGAFFLVAGLSEPLFLMSLIGFVYWCDRGFDHPIYFSLAALHGATVTGTRLLGIVVALYPLFLHLAQGRAFQPDRRANLLRAVMLGFFTTFGMLGFLLYNHILLGKWDSYFELNRTGWGTYAQPSLLFSVDFYLKEYFFGSRADVLGRTLIPITLSLTAWLAIRTWKTRKTEPYRLSLTLLAGALTCETVLARTSGLLGGMVRYLLPVNALLLPVIGSLLQDRINANKPLFTPINTWLLFLLLAIGMIFFAIQMHFISLFTSGQWVA